MKKIIVSTIFLLSLTIFNITNACSVTSDWSSDPKVHFESSDIVFVGTVTDFEHKGDINGTFIITFDVEKTYKGNVDNRVEVTTGANSALCGYDDPDLFKEGSVWSMYTTNSLSTSSITANTNFESIDEAVDEMDELLDPNNVFCTLNYDPVCGRKDTGIRCITTPCDSTEDVTYSNMCSLDVDDAEFLYEGECKIENGAPNNCKSWFDGCNQCVRSAPGGNLACTEMACLEDKEPVCREYFTIDPPVIENPIDLDIEITETDISDDDIKNNKGFWKRIIDLFTNILNFNF